MMRYCVCWSSALCFLMSGDSLSYGALESQSQEPYHITIAIQYSDDPIFTRVYQETLQRQVAGQLANDFGPVAKIQVVREHPLLDLLGFSGLSGLKDSPQWFAEHRVEGKMFLATLNFRDGNYHLTWRQLDGDMQQMGPVHSRSTPDRQWVAKAICLGVMRDFSPVAVIHPKANNKVSLEFRGGELGGMRQHWLSATNVFQPYRVERQRDGTLQRVPMTYTVLRVVNTDGKPEVVVESNQSNPWKQSPRIVGYQAVKLNTQQGQVRLRLVDYETGSPVVDCAVFASLKGFDLQNDRQRLDSPDRHGFVVSKTPFDHLVFLTLTQGAGSVYRIPLPITEDWCEITCKIPVDKKAGEKRDFERQLGYLVQDLRATHSAIDGLVREVNDLHTRKRLEDALKSAQSAARFAEQEKTAMQTTLNELKNRLADWQAKDSTTKAPPMLAWAEQQVQEVGNRAKALSELRQSLDDAINQREASKRAEVLANLGQQAEAEGDIEDAIAKYTLSLGEFPDQPGLKKHLDEMQEVWKIKSPSHAAARKFVVETWPKTELTQISSQLAQAEQSFTTLKSVQDVYTIRKLAMVNNDHLASLVELVDQLASRDTDADRAEKEKYGEITNKVIKFQDQVSAYLTNPGTTSSSTTEPPAKSETSSNNSPAAKKGGKMEEEEEALQK